MTCAKSPNPWFSEVSIMNLYLPYSSTLCLKLFGDFVCCLDQTYVLFYFQCSSLWACYHCVTIGAIHYGVFKPTLLFMVDGLYWGYIDTYMSSMKSKASMGLVPSGQLCIHEKTWYFQSRRTALGKEEQAKWVWCHVIGFVHTFWGRMHLTCRNNQSSTQSLQPYE